MLRKKGRLIPKNTQFNLVNGTNSIIGKDHFLLLQKVALLGNYNSIVSYSVKYLSKYLLIYLVNTKISVSQIRVDGACLEFLQSATYSWYGSQCDKDRFEPFCFSSMPFFVVFDHRISYIFCYVYVSLSQKLSSLSNWPKSN